MSSPRTTHCRQFITPPLTRRAMLRHCACGFGAVALTALHDRIHGGESLTGRTPLHGVHHPPKATNVIFLYMDGGPSQVDLFDPKPMLTKHHGEDPAQFFEVQPTQFNNNGQVLASPWSFARHGDAGIELSELLPNIATVADELAVIRSMVAPFPEHTFANYFLHTGSGFQGRPSMGAWVNYGLGSECENLPGFVVLNGGLIPPGGLDCFGSGFLPASYQGSIFKPSGSAVANINALGDRLTDKRTLLRKLDALSAQLHGPTDAVESAIHNYELAARMQLAVPELMRIDDETEATQQMYGLDAPDKGTQIYARQCLLARRLVERGVRFIELTCPSVGHDRWDQHSNLKRGHEDNCRTVDQPIAALLKDLRQRGMLDETLVIWAGEFGRTPFAQGANGRDHNPFGFSIWMAGGGVRGGTVHGATDEWGYRAIEGRQEIHDLHATMLHLLGVDHRRSTFRFGGRDMRLTDVHGHLIDEVIA